MGQGRALGLQLQLFSFKTQPALWPFSWPEREGTGLAHLDADHTSVPWACHRRREPWFPHL